MPRTETYAARQPPPAKGEDPVTVLVTGFGPFLNKYPKNSSWEIASTLPALLPATPSHPTPIHIHVHHAPVRVTYSHVVSLVPQLLPPANPITPAPSLILHIGLAAGRTYYTLEKGAHARGYGAIPDVDGERFPNSATEERFPRALFPPVLRTSLDVEDVVGRWRRNLGYEGESSSTAAGGAAAAAGGARGVTVVGVGAGAGATALASTARPGNASGEKKDPPDVRLSPDAGNFMCGFIYFNSLAHYFALKEDERPVAFLHVPDLSDSQEKLDTGREVAVALIRALVESRRVKGVVDGVERVKVEASGGRAGTDVNFRN